MQSECVWDVFLHFRCTWNAVVLVYIGLFVFLHGVWLWELVKNMISKQLNTDHISRAELSEGCIIRHCDIAWSWF